MGMRRPRPGPNHDRHRLEVDETVIAAYLEHIAGLSATDGVPAAAAVSADRDTTGISNPQAHPTTNSTGAVAAPRAPSGQSKNGCKTLLRQMGVVERDINACNDDLRMLQALFRAKRDTPAVQGPGARRHRQAAAGTTEAATVEPLPTAPIVHVANQLQPVPTQLNGNQAQLLQSLLGVLSQLVTIGVAAPVANPPPPVALPVLPGPQLMEPTASDHSDNDETEFNL